MSLLKENTGVLPLPSDLMPKCWNEEDRMKSLMAPFRNRAVNPEDWNSKFKFWQQMIKDWSSYHARCSFSLSDLNKNLKRNGCTALALPTVLQELYRNGEVILESDFFKEPSNTWTGWTIDLLIKKPVSWSFSKLKNYVTEPVIDLETKYIHLATTKELSEIILSVIDTSKENVLLSISDLTKFCIEKSGNNRITESNIKIALIYLRHSNKASFRESINDAKNDLLVKVSTNKAEKVTEADEGIHKLIQQESMLIKNIEQLELERNEVILKAKSSLSNGLKQVAKSFLRKKHEIDRCIEKRSSALHNVQTLLSRINDARADTDTLHAYKAGYNVLKKFEDTGLKEDNVQDTMDDMAEILEELKEVQSVMAQPVNTISESDSELEKELAEIMESASNDSGANDLNKSTIVCDLPDLKDLNLQDLPAPISKSSVNNVSHMKQTQ